ncbi:MAG: polyamine aminopropyltransferase [Acholeplasmatales bacterium]|nr:MAG: polyamine aminopropyltransferase [Acholeplasmatales bacterium]
MALKRYTEAWVDDVFFSIDATEHLHHETTPFQTIDFYASKTFGRFFTLDGLMMVTERDEFIYHDMISHVPLAVNPAIKKVLIIGGGDGGTAREIARYKHIETIDMVEIDERVVRLCQQYLPITAGMLDKDPRITLYFEDGLAYVKQVAPASYDLILVDSTDPIGPGEGLFTQAFYTHCFKALTDEGILINQHESPFFDVYREAMLKAHKKLKTVFPIHTVYQFHQPIYPSGHWLFGFASKKYHPLQDHQPKTWEAFGLKTRYYNSDLHRGAFALPSYVKDLLDHE